MRECLGKRMSLRYTERERARAREWLRERGLAKDNESEIHRERVRCIQRKMARETKRESEII